MPFSACYRLSKQSIGMSAVMRRILMRIEAERNTMGFLEFLAVMNENVTLMNISGTVKFRY